MKKALAWVGGSILGLCAIIGILISVSMWIEDKEVDRYLDDHC